MDATAGLPVSPADHDTHMHWMRKAMEMASFSFTEDMLRQRLTHTRQKRLLQRERSRLAVYSYEMVVLSPPRATGQTNCVTCVPCSIVSAVTLTIFMWPGNSTCRTGSYRRNFCGSHPDSSHERTSSIRNHPLRDCRAMYHVCIGSQAARN